MNGKTRLVLVQDRQTRKLDSDRTSDQSEVILSVATADMVNLINNAREKKIESYLDNIPDKKKAYNSSEANTETFKKLLIKPASIEIMTRIWFESEYVGNEAFEITGVHRKTDGNLNRYKLQKIIEQDQGHDTRHDFPPIKTAIHRICKAMLFYSLLKEDKNYNNKKPISGTIHLHNLMLEAHQAVNEILAKQLAG